MLSQLLAAAAPLDERRRSARLRGGSIGRIIVVGILLSVPGSLGPVAAEPKAEKQEVDTEHLFGFVEGADIGEAGERELVNDSTLRLGRNSGSFGNLANQTELKYSPFANFRIAAAATVGYFDVSGVDGLSDARHGAMQSASFDARYRILDREKAPFGLTLSVSPHLGFVDENSGLKTRHFGTDVLLLADRTMLHDQLAAAANIQFANDRARLIPGDGVEHESLAGFGASLADQIRPGVWLGAEARYLRDYSGPALNSLAGQAFYFGPTLYVRIGNRGFASVAWNFQVWGSPTGTPGNLDLINFDRHQAKFRVGVEF
jgi:hypothetical protein